jgi:hypothetical protein
MSLPLIPALARVLASIDAPRNFRALYALLASFCLTGLLLAMAHWGATRVCSAPSGWAWRWLSLFSGSIRPG